MMRTLRRIVSKFFKILGQKLHNLTIEFSYIDGKEKRKNIFQEKSMIIVMIESLLVGIAIGINVAVLINGENRLK